MLSLLPSSPSLSPSLSLYLHLSRSKNECGIVQTDKQKKLHVMCHARIFVWHTHLYLYAYTIR